MISARTARLFAGPFVVDVKAAAGLPAEPAGGDQVSEQRCRPVFVVAELAVQNLRDEQAAYRARSGRRARADPSGGSVRASRRCRCPRRCRGPPAAQSRPRSGTGSACGSRRNPADPSLVITVLPSRSASRANDLRRSRRSSDAAHDLDELHQRHRVHEVHADDAVGALGRRRPGA